MSRKIDPMDRPHATICACKRCRKWDVLVIANTVVVHDLIAGTSNRVKVQTWAEWVAQQEAAAPQILDHEAPGITFADEGMENSRLALLGRLLLDLDNPRR